MQKLFSLVVIGLVFSSVFGMKSDFLTVDSESSTSQRFNIQNQDFCTNEEPIAVLYVPDVRLLIAAFLFKATPGFGAIRTLQAWLSTDKKALGVFKQSKELTADFLKQLYHLSYQDGFFDRSFLKELGPLLCKEEVISFENTLRLGNDLVTLFYNCAHNGHWTKVLEKLEHTENASLVTYCIKNYYWICWEDDGSIKKTLLVYALELGAPDYIIEGLIKGGARLNQLSFSTPPPLVVVLNRFLTKTLPHERNEFYPAILILDLGKERWELLLNRLDETITLLIKAGATFDSLSDMNTQCVFWKSVYHALDFDEPVIVDYLNKKGFFTNGNSLKNSTE